MVISFASEPAFQYLKKVGYVVTYRKNERSRTPSNGEKQETWCNKGRGETREFDVHIRFLKEVPIEELHDTLSTYREHSGFPSMIAWVDEIESLNGGEVPDKGYLYLANRVYIEDREIEVDLPNKEALTA